MNATNGGRDFGNLLGRRPSVLVVCFAVWTLSNFDQALFGYAVPGILADLNVRLQAIGIILAVSFAAGACMVVLAGMAAARWGRAATLGVLLALSALSVGCQAFATGPVTLTIARALGFGFSAGLAPITNVLVAENAHKRTRGVVMGFLQCGFPLGWLLASAVASRLLTDHGWRAICLAAFAVAPIGILVTVWLSRKSGIDPVPPLGREAGEATLRPGLRQLFVPAIRPTAVATAATFFLFGGAYAGSAFFFPTFFVRARGYTPSSAASLVGISNGIAVFGYMGAAIVGEFVLTRRNVFVIWCIGGAACLIGLMWLSSGTLADTLWYGATTALFFGSQAVLIVLVSELFPSNIRTMAIAVCASAPVNLGFALFPLMVPLVVDAVGWQAGLSIAIVPALAGAGLAALLLQNRRSGLEIA